MQVVDPAVSRAKFDAELARFTALQPNYSKRGWLLLAAEFPIVEMAFLAVNVRPAVVALTVRFDFTNFDLHPLSVKFIDFLTRQELPAEQLVSRMKRLDAAVPPEVAAMMRQTGQPVPTQDLIQAYPGQPGFLCLPGVREYHAHPGHSGDAWELHRSTGEGSMLQIAEKIWQYGSNPIDAMAIHMAPVYQMSQVPA